MGLFTDAKQPSRAARLGPQRRRPQVLYAALAITVERGVAAVRSLLDTDNTWTAELYGRMTCGAISVA